MLWPEALCDQHFYNELHLEELTRPVVLYCAQNAVYYETSIFGSQWIDFYTETLGCNVLLWNYRGFGRSTGKITPDTLLEDATSVLSFLKYALQFHTLKKRLPRAVPGVFGVCTGGTCSCNIYYVANDSSTVVKE